MAASEFNGFHSNAFFFFKTHLENQRVNQSIKFVVEETPKMAVSCVTDKQQQQQQQQQQLQQREAANQIWNLEKNIDELLKLIGKCPATALKLLWTCSGI